MTYKITLVLLASLLAISNSNLMGQQLVKNINPDAADAFSSGRFTDDFATINGMLYFKADDGVHGPELWKSDGTADGTQLVKDIVIGADGSYPNYLTNWNGMLYFSGYADALGAELWKSDGTAAGTQLVKDINPNGHSSPIFIGSVGNILLFRASDGSSGKELWKTDGTTAGTVLVKDINSGISDSNPKQLGTTATLVFFTADNGTNGSEIWASDGTDSGTTLVKEIEAGSGGVSLSGSIGIGNLLYFGANTNYGWELWKSDGTEGGTVLVKDACEGGCSILPQFFTDLNGTLIFEAGDNFARNRELWRSNGTPESTGKITEINPGTTSGLSVSFPTVANGLVYFQADDGTSGKEPWYSDGTAANTKRLKNIAVGNADSQPGDFIALNEYIYFTANDGINGEEIWVTKGTEASTQLVGNINPGINSSTPYRFATSTDLLFFVANDGVNGNELWKIDPSTLSVPLPNNSCASAIPITPHNGTCTNPSIYSTENATNSNQNPVPTCANYSGADVWFTFTMPLIGQLFLETSNAGGIQNTGMEIYAGTCNALTSIACDADSGTGSFSKVEINGYGGQQLFARIWSKNGQITGDFALCAYGTPSSGSPTCDKAQEIVCGQVIRGHYQDLQDDVSRVCDTYVSADPELVFKFSPTVATTIVAAINYEDGDATQNHIWYLMDACDATSCFNISFNQQITFNNWEKDLFLVVGFPEPIANFGDYTISFSCGDDFCDNPAIQEVSCGQSIQGNYTSLQDNLSIICDDASFERDLLYKFSPAAATNLKVNVTYDRESGVLDGVGQEVFFSAKTACDESNCFLPDFKGQEIFFNDWDTDLYLLISFPEPTKSGNYTVHFSCGDTCSSTNDLPPNVIPLSCGAVYTGNTASTENLWKNDDLLCSNAGKINNNSSLTKDISHQFAITESMNVSIEFSYNQAQGEATAFVYDICSSLTTCLENSQLGNNPIWLRALPVGTYYVVVESNDALNYTLQVDCCEATPSNFSENATNNTSASDQSINLTNPVVLDFQELETNARTSINYTNDLANYSLIKINDFNTIRQTLSKEKNKEVSLRIPFKHDQAITLEVVERPIFAPNFKVKEKGSFGEKVVNLEMPLTYFGKVKGEEQSMASLSFIDDKLMAVFAFGGDNYNMEYNSTIATEDIYVLYKEKDYKGAVDFSCQVNEITESLPLERSPATNNGQSNTRAEEAINLYLECDYLLFLENDGSTMNTFTFVNSLFNVVTGIFSNAGINLQLSEVVVWTELDPYGASGQTSKDDIISAFTCVNKSGYNGAIGHLLSTTGRNLGGVANLASCSNLGSCEAMRSTISGFSDINPAYNSDVSVYSWSVNVFTHELGHQMGANHTHDCVWNGNNTPIDCCRRATACDCPVPSPTKGTIMSYCHQTDIGIDLAQGFHPQVATKMREIVNNGCIRPFSQSACSIPDASDISIQRVSATSVKLGTTLSADYYRWYWHLVASDQAWTFVPEPTPESSYLLSNLSADTEYEFALSVYCEDCKCWGNWNFGCTPYYFNTGTSEECKEDLVITDSPAEGDYLIGGNILTSSPGPVEVTGTATFQAGESVHLLKGFHAKAGSNFTATIVNCSNNLEEVPRTVLMAEKPIERTLPISNKQTTSLQIFPNPFSYATTIEFELPESSTIQINLYNLNGQLVKTIVPVATYDKGLHQLEITATHLNPSVYFLSLQTEKERLTQKLILR